MNVGDSETNIRDLFFNVKIAHLGKIKNI